MNDETPSQYPKQVPMAVPIRVPSRCGVKALLRAPLVWPHPGLSAGAAPVSLHHHILRQFAAPSATPPPQGLCLAYDNGIRCLHPMEEDGHQCEDQHERSIELTCDFLSIHNTFRLEAAMPLLFTPSQAWPGSPPSTPMPPPPLQTCLSLVTWGKLTILTGIMDSRSLGEERRDEGRCSYAEVLEGRV